MQLQIEFRAQSVSRRESATKCDAAVTGRDYLFGGCDAGALTICFELDLYTYLSTDDRYTCLLVLCYNGRKVRPLRPRPTDLEKSECDRYGRDRPT